MAGAMGRDITNVVWIGCLALLFLAVAVHEGWFAGTANPIITSGTENPSGTQNQQQQQDSQGGGVIYDDTYGALPNYGGD